MQRGTRLLVTKVIGLAWAVIRRTCVESLGGGLGQSPCRVPISTAPSGESSENSSTPNRLFTFQCLRLTAGSTNENQLGGGDLKRTVILSSLLLFACAVGTGFAETNNLKHVLLISVDGMHAVDFLNCAHGISTVKNGEPFCPAIAALGKTGINYVAASTAKPSDSFPGLTAIITGGSSALTGVYYDVAYSRNYDAPSQTTGNGVAGGPCTAGATPTGTTTE